MTVPNDEQADQRRKRIFDAANAGCSHGGTPCQPHANKPGGNVRSRLRRLETLACRSRQQKTYTEVRDLDARRSVLIVDQSSETREVLRTVLEQRGLRIYEASAPDEGLEIVQSQRPDLVVLDVEVETASPAEVSGRFASRTRPRQTPLVLLGTARRTMRRLPGEFVAKPYHYAPLIRRIEQLLDAVQ